MADEHVNPNETPGNDAQHQSTESRKKSSSRDDRPERWYTALFDALKIPLFAFFVLWTLDVRIAEQLMERATTEAKNLRDLIRLILGEVWWQIAILAFLTLCALGALLGFKNGYTFIVLLIFTSTLTAYLLVVVTMIAHVYAAIDKRVYVGDVLETIGALVTQIIFWNASIIITVLHFWPFASQHLLEAYLVVLVGEVGLMALDFSRGRFFVKHIRAMAATYVYLVVAVNFLGLLIPAVLPLFPQEVQHAVSNVKNAVYASVVHSDVARPAGDVVFDLTVNDDDLLELRRHLRLRSDTTAADVLTGKNLAYADVNRDSVVDSADLKLFERAMAATGQYYDPRLDLNHDGVVNLYDLDSLSSSTDAERARIDSVKALYQLRLDNMQLLLLEAPRDGDTDRKSRSLMADADTTASTTSGAQPGTVPSQHPDSMIQPPTQQQSPPPAQPRQPLQGTTRIARGSIDAQAQLASAVTVNPHQPIRLQCSQSDPPFQVDVLSSRMINDRQIEVVVQYSLPGLTADGKHNAVIAVGSGTQLVVKWKDINYPTRVFHQEFYVSSVTMTTWPLNEVYSTVPLNTVVRSISLTTSVRASLILTAPEALPKAYALDVDRVYFKLKRDREGTWDNFLMVSAS